MMHLLRSSVVLQESASEYESDVSDITPAPSPEPGTPIPSPGQTNKLTDKREPLFSSPATGQTNKLTDKREPLFSSPATRQTNKLTDKGEPLFSSPASGVNRSPRNLLKAGVALKPGAFSSPPGPFSVGSEALQIPFGTPHPHLSQGVASLQEGLGRVQQPPHSNLQTMSSPGQTNKLTDKGAPLFPPPGFKFPWSLLWDKAPEDLPAHVLEYRRGSSRKQTDLKKRSGARVVIT
uniref:Uncharacterized protein n=1 Tax=Chromera velia CCMP2878 TaxID=1169474 RepID=A0A0G4GXR7_9ALVE|eukprot:Cvel_23823.t1-p1 / transcript=Cvel_23823.t1 / gene=Cvel_23823 / organism=Chromera_velia_CCMP2878 / gene_product=hypothetical protein / transcript_product=hypothetical protein / location=Cvel_scaffold2504:3488-5242(+) / protein_length=234 / sequence_SO=supercontig / SO=protein_coding / is_pseudo=false